MPSVNKCNVAVGTDLFGLRLPLAHVIYVGHASAGSKRYRQYPSSVVKAGNSNATFVHFHVAHSDSMQLVRHFSDQGELHQDVHGGVVLVPFFWAVTGSPLESSTDAIDAARSIVSARSSSRTDAEADWAPSVTIVSDEPASLQVRRCPLIQLRAAQRSRRPDSMTHLHRERPNERGF